MISANPGGSIEIRRGMAIHTSKSYFSLEIAGQTTFQRTGPNAGRKKWMNMSFAAAMTAAKTLWSGRAVLGTELSGVFMRRPLWRLLWRPGAS